MRRFELVEGTAAKFWQVEVTGSSFQVTFGRLGTAGQTQVKSFADAAKAQAEADKLIREKKGKGYREVGAAGAAGLPPAPVATAAIRAPASSPPAEKAEEPVAQSVPEAAGEPIAAAVVEAEEDPEPIAWTPAWRALAPARRGFAAPPPPSDLQAVWNALRKARLKAGFKPAERSFLQQIGIADPEAWLGSAEPPAPRRAAEDAVLLVLFKSPAAIDFLVLQGGLVHAFEALAGALGNGLWDRVVLHGGRSFADFGYWLALRRHVVAAPPESYAALRAVAEAARQSSEPWLANRTMLLFPDEPWAGQELARVGAAGSGRQPLGIGGLLVEAGLEDAAEWLAGGGGELYEWQGHGLAQGLLAKHGAAAAPLLAQIFDRSHYVQTVHREMLAGLGAVRTREAFGLLLERSQDRQVAPVAHAALLAFPRLGIEAAAEHVGRFPKQEGPRLILRTLVAAHPALAAAAVAQVSPAGAAAVKALLGDGRPRVDAAPETWPEVLRSPAAAPARLPVFWDAALYAPPRLCSGESLPGPAVDRLGALLAARPDPADAGIRQVREACEPASLDAFAWDLFEAWLAFGAPAKEQWAMFAMGLLGGDGCARRLAPLIREWPGEAAHARAVLGLDVLAAIGSDVALVLLQSIADKVKFKGLQDRAREKITAVAEQRGLSAEDLADRLTPDLGLGEDGSLRLDFGPRRFRVSFDEQLRPVVSDEQGKGLGDLPKPRAADDAALAAAAAERFKLLKKDAKSLAGLQILRLERAMASGRRFGREVFESGFARHPLIRHLARRLVWAAHSGDDSFNFRVAEDGTCTDREDAAWQLPESCEVSVPHRLFLPDEVVAAFAQIFADYELLQPFPQLGREIFALTEGEKKQDELKRFAGRKVATGKLLGLEKRGWRRGAPEDGGVAWYFERQLEGKILYLTFHDGIYDGDLASTPEQTLDELLLRRGASWDVKKELAFGTLSPLEASEMLRDLHLLCG